MYLTHELYEQNNYKIKNYDIWHAYYCAMYLLYSYLPFTTCTTKSGDML